MRRDANESESPHLADDHPLAQLLEEYAPVCSLERGAIVRGVIVQVEQTALVVDVGAKCEGVVPERELARLAPGFLTSLKPGVEIDVCVLNPDGPRGEIVLSILRAQQAQDWCRARALKESGEIVELEVDSSNRGGLLVHIGGLRGFVPASQLDPARGIPRISDPTCSEALSRLVGNRIRLVVIEADQDRNRLILSERAALSRQREEESKRILATLQEGEVRKGRVRNLTHFGAFIDLGGLDGLLHLSEISWQPVEHPAEVLQVGQEVEVLVLSVDRERQQVALSMKRLEPDPWVTVGERYRIGQLVQARITRLTKWGAFARIIGDEAIEGLIHISELDERRLNHPSEVVQPGDVVTLRVIRLEPERHRMGLSLRQALRMPNLGERARGVSHPTQGPPPPPLGEALHE
ncbi:MAG TPA: S1 RNA-binding domain-containing protein [Anaerolineae bacterium]|nr:S1 RNA-binding domain-containing protein [Anaerolineae bacterium]